MREESAGKECTFPPPGDGLYVLFLCKFGCGANLTAGHTYCGLYGVIGDFIASKVLQKNEKSLHCVRGIGRDK